MFVHGHEELDTVCGAPVLSQVISQYESFGGDTYQEIHQIIFVFGQEVLELVVLIDI